MKDFILNKICHLLRVYSFLWRAHSRFHFHNLCKRIHCHRYVAVLQRTRRLKRSTQIHVHSKPRSHRRSWKNLAIAPRSFSRVLLLTKITVPHILSDKGGQRREPVSLRNFYTSFLKTPTMTFPFMDRLNSLKTLFTSQNPPWFHRRIAHINPDHHILVSISNQPKRFASFAKILAKALELFAHLMGFQVQRISEVLEGLAQELLPLLKGRRDEAVGGNS
jgi:hypothetical protein